MVRNSVEIRSDEPYGAVEADASKPAPVSLTVLVQR